MFPLPNPLHPAVVHLPLALALLLPLFAGFAATAVARAWFPLRAWSFIIVLHALLTGSGWMALETGEDQRERVKEFVSRDLVESHHEQGMLFVGVAAGALLGSGRPPLPGTPGSRA
jgi:uncharacterized membrane protein